MQLSGAHGRVRSTGALLLPLEAVVSGEPARTLARDELRSSGSAAPWLSLRPGEAEASAGLARAPGVRPFRLSNARLARRSRARAKAGVWDELRRRGL